MFPKKYFVQKCILKCGDPLTKDSRWYALHWSVFYKRKAEGLANEDFSQSILSLNILSEASD